MWERQGFGDGRYYNAEFRMTASSPVRCSIGFVAPDRPRAKLLGSGILVSFGKLYGILTAAHVLETLQKVEEIGFVECTIRPAQPQGLRFLTNAIDSIKFGEQPDDRFGPDLAFIRLPDHTAAALNANSSFLNLAQQAELSNAPPLAGAERLDVIVGAIDEWGADDSNASAGLDMGIITVLTNSDRNCGSRWIRSNRVYTNTRAGFCFAYDLRWH